MEYPPILCNNANCKAVLNPYCQIDFRMKCWHCPVCQTKNMFPPHYAENISETSLPFELMEDYSTMEYILPATTNQQDSRPVFILVVDTAVSSEELVELKDSLQQSINFIPPDAMVGLITYGKMIQVHEVGFSECPKAYVFRGDKALTQEQIRK